MVSETRANDRLSDLEKRVDGQTTMLENTCFRLEQNTTDISDVKFTMSQIQASLKELATGVASLTAHAHGDPNGDSSSSPYRNSHIQFGTYGNGPSYFPPTKQTRVEFPKFDGSDFRGWSYRCRQFFAVDATPPEQRIRLISIHLEGKALKWHLNLLKTRRDDDLSWEMYLSCMEARFSDVKCINPMVQLKQLQQITSVDKYIEAFDDLLTEVTIPE